MESQEGDEYNQLMTNGASFMSKREFDLAVECFESAINIMIAKYGEMDIRVADTYLAYGKALFEFQRAKNDVLGSMFVPGANDEDDTSEEDEVPEAGDIENENNTRCPVDHIENIQESGKALQSNDTGPTSNNLVEVGENNQNSAEQEEEAKESNEIVSDLMVAWENLEMSRVLYSKQSDPIYKVKLADAKLYLGLIEFDSGRESNAINEIQEALTILKDNEPNDSRLIAEMSFQLATVYSYSGLYSDAKLMYNYSREVLMLHLNNMKNTCSENSESMAQIMNILKDLDEKIEDCSNTIQNTESSKTSDNQVMNEKTNDGALRDIPENVSSDLTHLVKRKKCGESAEDVLNKAPKTTGGSHA